LSASDLKANYDKVSSITARRKALGTRKIDLPVWSDVDLSGRGRVEASEAGRLFKSYGYSFDCAYTSLLKRAIRTLWLVLDQLDLMWIPVDRSRRLNERHYGGFTRPQQSGAGGIDKVALSKIDQEFQCFHVPIGRYDRELDRHPGESLHLRNER